MAETLYVVSYDVEHNRARRRVAAKLEDAGVRVQGSVFEVRMSRAGIEALARVLTLEISDTDSLRVYPIPENARRRAIIAGAPPVSEPGPFWIV